MGDSIDPESDLLELQVGILNKPLNILKATSENNKQNNKRTLCALLIDETNLIQKYEKFKGKMWGYTEGMGKKTLNEPKKMASKAVIFMVISLTDDWKIPIGLFFLHNPDIKYFADTIEETLTKLDKINIDVLSITLNCVSPHLSFALAEELGAEVDFMKSTATNNINASFIHPSNRHRVHIFYDLSIVLDSLKNCWVIERNLVYKKKKLDFSLISDVRKLEENDMQSYGMDTVYDWIIIKKRLSFEPASISKTTADAMQYLKDLGHPDFNESEGTIQFIRVLDLISQLANASGQEGELFQCISEINENQWKPVIVKLLDYVKHLKSLNKDTSKHLSGFRVYIIGLLVSFTSFLELYEGYIKATGSNTHILRTLLPIRLGLKNISVLFDSWTLKNMTALFVFKEMNSLIEKVHPID